jgi:hypothetical protein
MPKKAVIAAGGVAVLGALAWALIMWGLEREFFYMAALVGALVGLAAAYFKAQGMTAGIVCAVLTVGAIGGGKVLGFQFAFDGIVEKMTAEETTESEYNTAVADARDFEGVTKDGYAIFMVDYGYTDAGSPEEVKPDELAGFKKFEVPNLLRLKDAPAYEEWRDWRQAELAQLYRREIKPWAMLVHMDLDDAFFLLIGIIMAFALAKAGWDHLRPRRRETAES